MYNIYISELLLAGYKKCDRLLFLRKRYELPSFSHAARCCRVVIVEFCVKMMVYSSGALGGLEVVEGGLVGGELAAHVLSAQAAAHAAATAAAQQQQMAVQQIS